MFVIVFFDADIKDAELIRKQGIALKNKGQYEDALSTFQQALKLFQQSGDSVGIANVYNNMGIVWFYRSNFSKCLYYYQESEKIFNELSYADGLARVHIGFGNYFMYHERNFKLAIEHFSQSREIYEREKNWKKLMLILNNIANVYSTEHAENQFYSIDSARQFYREALAISINLSDSLQIGGILMNLGQNEEKQNPETALIYYDLAEDIFVDLDNKHKLASIYLNRGKFYRDQKLYQKSVDESIKALQLARENGFTDFIHSAGQNLAHSYEALGLTDSALHYFKIYKEYGDTIYNQAKIKEIENLKAKYDSDKKDKEIKLTAAQRDMLMYTLMVGLVLTLVVIIFYNQRQRINRRLRRKEQELHEQEVNKLIQGQELKSINSMLEGEERERKRIAEDLHDSVGSMLSAMKLQVDETNGKMVELLDETAEEVRRISHNLETRVLNRFGLIAALEDLTEKITNSNKVRFELQHLDLDDRLDSNIEINVYRIVQELISNALKHSQATEIIAQVNRVDEHLIIMVEDNGVGFDSLMARESEGMGLKNIRSRVQELNGDFNIDSGQNQGTVVTVELAI